MTSIVRQIMTSIYFSANDHDVEKRRQLFYYNARFRNKMSFLMQSFISITIEYEID